MANDSPSSPQNGEISIHLASSSPNRGDSLYFLFPVGIEGLGIEYGTRSAVTQALDAFWLDSLGPSIVSFTISGHTGWKSGIYRDNTGPSGREAFMRLLAIHKEHQNRLKQFPNQQKALLFFIDRSTGFQCWCFATSLRITRDRSSPILFHFEWALTVVKDQSDYTKVRLL